MFLIYNAPLTTRFIDDGLKHFWFLRWVNTANQGFLKGVQGCSASIKKAIKWISSIFTYVDVKEFKETSCLGPVVENQFISEPFGIKLLISLEIGMLNKVVSTDTNNHLGFFYCGDNRDLAEAWCLKGVEDRNMNIR